MGRFRPNCRPAVLCAHLLTPRACSRPRPIFVPPQILSSCPASSVPWSILDTEVALRQKRLGGSSHSPPRLDLREYHLPWAPFSIPSAAGQDKPLPSRPVTAVAAAACSKVASASFGLPVRRAVIAARPAARRPGAGAAGRRVVAGGPVSLARPAGASSAAARGDASRWSFSPSCRRSPSPWCRRRP